MNIIKRIYFSIMLLFHKIMFNISVALYGTELEILKADLNNLSEKDKKNIRKIHRNPLLEKFYAGQRDEKYMKEYYELLRKADKFIENSSAFKMAATNDKLHMNYGRKDKYGRRYEHYGFFDDKHKNHGKTLGEVLSEEIIERRTKDDDYELLYIFNNHPIETGLRNVFDILEEDDEKKDLNLVDITKKSKQFVFPIKIEREEGVEVTNKIEQLAEFLHVKKIGFEFRQLEFFIPLKFKINEVENDSDIFNEITNIKSIYIRAKYGEYIAFTVNNFKKRIIHEDTYEVWKFDGIEMKIINQNN